MGGRGGYDGGGETQYKPRGTCDEGVDESNGYGQRWGKKAYYSKEKGEEGTYKVDAIPNLFL